MTRFALDAIKRKKKLTETLIGLMEHCQLCAPPNARAGLIRFQFL